MAKQNTEVPNLKSEPQECFVIMPISDPPEYERGHFRQVYEDLIIKPCEMAGFKAVRADDIKSSHIIHIEILNKLIACPMAICDLSSRNPNVLFELGLRQAFNKPTVIIQEVGTPDIFDTSIIHYTLYRKELKYREVLEDQTQIRIALEATYEASKTPGNSNSIIKLLSVDSPATLKEYSENEKTNSMLRLLLSQVADLKSLSYQKNKSLDRKVADIEIETFEELQKTIKSFIVRATNQLNGGHDHDKIWNDFINFKEKVVEDLKYLSVNSNKNYIFKEINEFENELRMVLNTNVDKQ